MAHFRDVLGNRNFFCLWAGQIISQFGDRLNQMALVALVYKNAPGSPLKLAQLILFMVIPVFLIGPIAGVYVDRWDKKKVMVMSDILRGVLVLFIPLFVVQKSLFMVYVIVFLIFSISRFFLPSKMSIIPNIVPPDKLLLANSLSDTTRMIATFVGLALAGVVVQWVGVVGSFYIDAATYFISALSVGLIAVKKQTIKFNLSETKEAIQRAINKTLIKEIKEGLIYFATNTNIRFVGIVLFLLLSGIGAISCVSIVYIQESFGSITEDLGFFGMLLGIGLFIGAIIYGKFGGNIPKKLVIFYSFLACGIVIIFFTLAVRFYSHVLAPGILIFALGISAGPIVTSGNTLVHETLPDDARGRVFSSLELVMHLGFLIFMFLTSAIAEKIDKIWVLLSSGLIFLIAGLIGVYYIEKQNRKVVFQKK